MDWRELVVSAGAPWETGAFPLAFFPPLAILAGVGLQALLVNLGVRRVAIAMATSIVGTAVGAGLALMLAWGGRDAGDFYCAADARPCHCGLDEGTVAARRDRDVLLA